MPKQPAFPSLRNTMKKRLTRRELFLAQSEVQSPLVRRSAERGGALAAASGADQSALPEGWTEGRPPMPLETMLRVYFRQNAL